MFGERGRKGGGLKTISLKKKGRLGESPEVSAEGGKGGLRGRVERPGGKGREGPRNLFFILAREGSRCQNFTRTLPWASKGIQMCSKGTPTDNTEEPRSANVLWERMNEKNDLGCHPLVRRKSREGEWRWVKPKGKRNAFR